MSDKYYGVYPAFVSNVKDPENRGRIRCISPEVLGDDNTQTGWCEPCIPIGSDFYVPPLKEGVYIMFEEGDINQPVYLGSWYAEGEIPDGVNFNNITDKRFIIFKNNVIIMKEEGIQIKTSNDNNDVEINITDSGVSISGNVTIDGDLEVTGEIVR